MTLLLLVPRQALMMTNSRVRFPIATEPLTRDVARTRSMLRASIVVALVILIATACALAARDPYRSGR